MSGEVLGRRLLRLDAAYCAVAGLLAVVLFAPLADLFDAPRLVPAAAGAATVAWAVVLHRLARRSDWRQPVAAVAAANTVGAGGLAVLALIASTIAGAVLLALVAVEVALFAVGQLAALKR